MYKEAGDYSGHRADGRYQRLSTTDILGFADAREETLEFCSTHVGAKTPLAAIELEFPPFARMQV
jgi:hypothetical protein